MPRYSGKCRNLTGEDAVSYTHLDVYKRQVIGSCEDNGCIYYLYLIEDAETDPVGKLYVKKNQICLILHEPDVYKRQT